MKSYLAIFFALSVLVGGCAHRSYSDKELRTLLVGKWDSSTSFKTNAVDTRIESKSKGTITFNNDATYVSQSETRMAITVPEGRLPVHYQATVQGTWSISNQTVAFTRVSEEVTAQDDLSRNFIEREGMKKLRAESPTNFVFRLKKISPGKILTTDEFGGTGSLTKRSR